jgi:hypothetical protein
MATNITVLTNIKRFTYRGDTQEEFSNTFHFLGLPPTTQAEWQSLATEVVQIEQGVFDDTVTFSRSIGHISSDAGAVAVYDFDWIGTGNPPLGAYVDTGGRVGSGDQASCVEWLTNLKTSRGKPIYLRKYLHHPFLNAVLPDDLDASYITALDAYAAKFVGATVWGGLTNPEKTATVASSKVIPYVTTRTLKRRGKRKKVA